MYDVTVLLEKKLKENIIERCPECNSHNGDIYIDAHGVRQIGSPAFRCHVCKGFGYLKDGEPFDWRVLYE